MTLQLRKAAGIHEKLEGGIKTTWERQGLQWEEGAKGGLYFTGGRGRVGGGFQKESQAPA